MGMVKDNAEVELEDTIYDLVHDYGCGWIPEILAEKDHKKQLILIEKVELQLGREVRTLLQDSYNKGKVDGAIIEINRVLHRTDPSKPASRHIRAYLKERKAHHTLKRTITNE